MNDIRQQFPLLQKTVSGQPLVYFDNAATTPKPQVVIDAIATHYKEHAGNPGRALHTLSLEAEQIITVGRQKVLEFFTAPNTYTTVFTKSTTESINMIAWSLLYENRTGTDKKPVVITTQAEHHSNFLPWLRLHKEFGFELHIVPVLPTGEINLSVLEEITQQHPQALIAITHCSNVTGLITNLAEVCRIAQNNCCKILIDAAQSSAHIPINITKTPVDYLVASAHKIYGPEGVGILVMKKAGLENTEPLIVGGGMVETVSENDYTWRTTEARIESGTPNTAGIAGMIAALNFISTIGVEAIQAQEQLLTQYFVQKIENLQLAGITLYGTTNKEKLPIFVFSHIMVHPHDISDFLDQHGIAVRSGYHCAEPLHKALNCPATTRVSLSFLNTTDEIDYFFAVLQKCLKKFA